MKPVNDRDMPRFEDIEASKAYWLGRLNEHRIEYNQTERQLEADVNIIDSAWFLSAYLSLIIVVMVLLYLDIVH